MPGTKVPQQDNGIDCGVFMLSFADAFSKDEPPFVNSADIQTYRRILALEPLQMEFSPEIQNQFFAGNSTDAPGRNKTTSRQSSSSSRIVQNEKKAKGKVASPKTKQESA